MTRHPAATVAPPPADPLALFSTAKRSSASPARVDGWPQEPTAVAPRRVPSGLRQGGRWGSTT